MMHPNRKDNRMARATVVPQSVEYPESDGLPMPDSPEQFDSLAYSVVALKLHYRERDDVFVGGDMLLYYERAAAPGETGKSVAPDTFVAFGVPRKGRGERPSYLLWEERKVPDFALEIASRSTYRVDQGDKRRLYERLGVREYWLYDPAAGPGLLSLDETEDARQAAEAARENVETRLEEAEVHLQQAQDRLQEEQATRQVLATQLRDLQRRMRAAGQEPDDRPEHGR